MHDTAEIGAATAEPGIDGKGSGEKLAFIHIPKTAGTSFTRALVIGWPRTRIVATADEFRKINEAEAGGLDLIAGHFNAFQMDTPQWAGFSGLTVLRDPRAKLVSSYRFARSRVLYHGITGTPQMRFAARASFAEYVFSSFGVHDRHAQVYNLGRCLGENPNELLLSELLERAKARLESIEVGTADRLQDFVDHLFRRFDKGPAPTLQRLNTAEETGEFDMRLTRSQDAALRELMQPDEDLFAHAKALFAARVEAGQRGTETLGVPASAAAVPDEPGAPPAAPPMLVGTFGNAGTLLMLPVLRRIANQLGYGLWVPNRKPPPESWAVMLQPHSAFPAELLAQPHRGAIVIRDPRDIIVSGAQYHARGDSDREPWLHRPDAKFGGKSYHEVIAALPTDAEKFIFEMDNDGARTIDLMRSHLDLSSDFINVRFEDLIADTDLVEFRRMFTWLGIREADMDRALKIAGRSSLPFGQAETEHLRSGKPAQWRQHFTPALHEEFRKRFGDIAERLGYPTA